jgi:hypothetical protein
MYLLQQGLRGTKDDFDSIFPELKDSVSCQDVDLLLEQIALNPFPSDYEDFVAGIMANAVV